MSKIIEYFVSKLSFETARHLIDNVQAFSYDNENLNDEGTKDRNWLVGKSNSGYTISALDKNSEGTWVRSNKFIYNNGYLLGMYLCLKTLLKDKHSLAIIITIMKMKEKNLI